MYSSLCVEHCTFFVYNIPVLFNENVVDQSVLVKYYCCFHLNSGTTTVGPGIVTRNKKRSLLCTPHHAQRSESKIRGILAANKPQNISAAPACVV